jgi:D-alanyl-D-alanine carboxypeptidase
VLAPLLGQDMRTNNLTWAGPGGGMVSSLGDLTRWSRALFGGRALPSPQLAKMTEVVSVRTGLPIPDVTAADPGGFSLGIGRFYSADVDGAYWAYLGEMLGTRTLIAYWPQYDLVITTATNSNPSEDGLGAAVLLPAFNALKDTGAIQGTSAAVPTANDAAATSAISR